MQNVFSVCFPSWYTFLIIGCKNAKLGNYSPVVPGNPPGVFDSDPLSFGIDTASGSCSNRLFEFLNIYRKGIVKDRFVPLLHQVYLSFPFFRPATLLPHFFTRRVTIAVSCVGAAVVLRIAKRRRFRRRRRRWNRRGEGMILKYLSLRINLKAADSHT